MGESTPTLERLTHLLALQDEARGEREDLVRQREEIMRQADDEQRVDLNKTEDEAFRSLTRRIAVIDESIEKRDALIEPLAELSALDIPVVANSPEAEKRAAAAEIFVGWRNTSPRARSHPEDAPARRNLTLAEARTVTLLDI